MHHSTYLSWSCLSLSSLFPLRSSLSFGGTDPFRDHAAGLEALVVLVSLSRFLLRSFRFSPSDRWLSRCRAAVAVAELFAAAAAGDTLRCCFLALLSCPPPLVLVLVMLLFVVLFFPQVIRPRR